ncbi:MAG: hypothetical protein VYC39_07155 [Myxococcota bacterium]|nr:hypothetical protein [Myxococcota bacterium]
MSSATLPKAKFVHDEVLAYEIRDAAGKAIGRTRTIYRVNAQGQVKVRTRTQKLDSIREYSWVFTADDNVSFFKRLCSKEGLHSLQWKPGIVMVSDGVTRTEYKTTADMRLPMTADTPFALNLLTQRLDLRVGTSVSSRYFDPVRRKQVPLQLTIYTNANGEIRVSSALGTATFDNNGRLALLKSVDGRSFVRSANVKPISAVTLPKKLTYRPPEMPAWKDEPVQLLSRAGVLSVPRNLSRWPRLRAPVIFLFSDSQRQDRYGISTEIDHGTWQIQDHLLEAGYAVLRLDDGPEPENRESVAAILQFLSSQSAIDADSIILLGHGTGIRPALEGAVHSPELVKGVGILAGDWGALPDALKLKLGSLQNPIAVFQGLKDIEVSWKTDTKALVDLLKGRPGGTKNTQSKYYSRVDHLMKSESKTSTRVRYRDASRRVERDFLRDLLEWLDSNPKIKE